MFSYKLLKDFFRFKMNYFREDTFYMMQEKTSENDLTEILLVALHRRQRRLN